MSSPCHECPYRKLVCHDHCQEYASYHEALVEAKEAVNKAQNAIDFLMKSAEKRERRMRVRK